LTKPEILTVAKLWPPYLQSLQETYIVHDRTHESDPAKFAEIAPRIRAIAGGGESQVTGDGAAASTRDDFSFWRRL
jgi:hydroxypyruvate reductase